MLCFSKRQTVLFDELREVVDFVAARYFQVKKDL